MGTVLGIDTSSTDLSVGLYKDGAPVASFTRYIGNSHAEHIGPVVRTMLQSLSEEVPDRIAAAVGPGSFTGLRIGISFIKGYCTAVAAPVLPLSSLFILAHVAQRPPGRIAAAIDGRNDTVYWAFFSRSNNVITSLSEDRVTPVAEFMAALEPRDTIVTDTVGYTKSTAFSSLDKNYTVLAVESNPLSRGLLCAAAGDAAFHEESKWVKARELRPNYLRAFASLRQTATERGSR